MSEPRRIGWEVFQHGNVKGEGFDFFGPEVKQSVKGNSVAESVTESKAESKAGSKDNEARCKNGHVWKANKHVHNKGRGKYLWYRCSVCGKRQRRFL